MIKEPTYKEDIKIINVYVSKNRATNEARVTKLKGDMDKYKP